MRLSWLIGGGAVAAYLLTRTRETSKRVRATPEVLPGSWVWPVPTLEGRPPAISDGFDSPRPGLPFHGGVDIMYLRKPSDPQRVGTPNGTRMFVMPENILVVAASDGVVWSAAKTSTGHAVVIDHGPRKVATLYAHLEMVFVEPKQRVKAGEMIGIVGGSPKDPARLKHLHFEVWLGGPDAKIDPASLMKSWPTVIDPRRNARNGSLVYRAVGESGAPYPQWVRDLKGKAGVYVIREDGETVYVGSSRTQLYDTMTRHFQTWRRWKGYWKGQYAEGHDPGLTYARDRVEVAVRITSPADALDEEMRLIQRLQPRDNIIGQPIDDEVPF